MNPDTGKTMMVAALGRPFSLGMLYDCRNDSLIPGMTLWDSDLLVNHIGERSQSYNNFEILSSESIEDKSSALNVKASLKASFLSGLVDVEGSAKYLHDDKTSKSQARVTLKYDATTKFQELSMDHLGRGNVKYPYVFDQGIATHVVTGILYGATAFFVFDRDVSDDETHQDVEGYLKLMINKIPSVGIGGSGSVKLDDEDVEKVEKFSCKFHGDFLLKKCPSTYEEAVTVYQSLPTLLGENGESAVPMQVWLLPLTNLDSKAAKLVREISATFVNQAQNVLEDLKEVEVRCNDALKTTSVQQFPSVGKKIKSFKEVCGEFKVEFQRQLAQILPSIRGGGEEEAKLGEILEKRISSPFSNTSLNRWMDSKEREIYTVMSFTRMMNSTKVITSQNHLFKEVLSVENAVCFIFTSLESEEPYLLALAKYLKEPDNQDPSSPDLDDQWFTSKELGREMRTKAKLIDDFAEANEQNSKLKFLVAGLKDESHKGSTIYLYKDGFTVSEDFVPPSKPETVTVQDVDHNTLVLKISAPRFGAENDSSYSVEFCPKGEDEWKQKTAPTSGEVTVSDLKPNTEYLFRCRAVTSLGLGPAYNPMDPIRTLPCSPPWGLHVEKDVCELTVSWVQPAVIGPWVEILGYTVEYAVSKPGTSDPLWKQIKSSSQGVTISGLQSDTDYAVRIRCDCGESGMSKESPTVVWRTPDTYLLLLQELLQDFPGLDTKLENVLHSTTVQNFPQMALKVRSVKSLFTKFSEVTLALLKEETPSLLSRDERKHVIMTMFKWRNATPYRERDLRTWIQWKEREIQFVQTLMHMMPNTECVPTEAAFNVKFHPLNTFLVFVFCSLGDAEEFLAALSDCNEKLASKLPVEPHSDPADWVPWFKEHPETLVEKARLFGDFAEANKQNKDIKFLTLGLKDEAHRGVTIYSYQNGHLVNQDFVPPSKPESMEVMYQRDSIDIIIKHPKFGAENVTSYSLELIPLEENVKQKQMTAPRSGHVRLEKAEISGYSEIACRAMTAVGVGPAYYFNFDHHSLIPGFLPPPPPN